MLVSIGVRPGRSQFSNVGFASVSRRFLYMYGALAFKWRRQAVKGRTSRCQGYVIHTVSRICHLTTKTDQTITGSGYEATVKGVELKYFLMSRFTLVTSYPKGVHLIGRT
jgi:hypothetical protein